MTPDRSLLAKVRDAALRLEALPDAAGPAGPAGSSSASSSASTADFFLALTICNSVMVSTATEPRQRVGAAAGGGWEGSGQGVSSLGP